MIKNNNEKNFDITIVGGGLTGKLMAYIIIKSNVVPKKRLCWINTENQSNIDKRVSFMNYNNFLKLENKFECNFLKKNFIKIR